MEANDKMADAPVTKITVGKLHIIVHSQFSKTSSETAADKAKKLILKHSFDQFQASQGVDSSASQSEHGM